MEKEQVTVYQIKKDLIRYIFQEIIGILVGFPMLWFLLALINFLSNNTIMHVVFKVLTIMLLLLSILSLIYTLIIQFDIKKENFELRNDVLTEKRDFNRGGTKWHSYKPYRLSFNRGHFDIPAQLNYKWSSIYSMNEKEIYNTSSIGDSFTLIEYNKKILVVYNNKFFNVSSAKS